MASSSFTRCPIEATPSSFRVSCVRPGRTVSSMSFSRNAASYFPRPRLRSQTTTSMTAPLFRVARHHDPCLEGMSSRARCNPGACRPANSSLDRLIAYWRALHIRRRVVGLKSSRVLFMKPMLHGTELFHRDVDWGVARPFLELEVVNQPRESVPARSALSSAADVIRLYHAQQVGELMTHRGALACAEMTYMRN